MRHEELGKYADRLLGLIPVERITTVNVERTPKALIEKLYALDGLTATVSDVLDSLGIQGVISASVLKPLIPGKKVIGNALTLRYLPERDTPTALSYSGSRPKLADRDVYALAEEGDVAVFDVNGLGDISTMGGLSALMAAKAKLAGNIVDSGIRDVDVIKALDYPVWSRGITPRSGKYRLEAIEINGPIMCAGIQVHPGDLVIADDTGVVFVPGTRSVEVIEKTIAIAEKEDRLVAAINSGASIPELKKIISPDKW